MIIQINSRENLFKIINILFELKMNSTNNTENYSEYIKGELSRNNQNLFFIKVENIIFQAYYNLYDIPYDITDINFIRKHRMRKLS